MKKRITRIRYPKTETEKEKEEKYYKINQTKMRWNKEISIDLGNNRGRLKR